MNRLSTILAATVVTLGCNGALADTFFVATDGSDTNPGTEGKPFATLQHARDAVRKFKETAPVPESVTVVVRGGTYRIDTSLTFNAEDSGIETAPVVWQAATGEEVRLSGGPTLPPDAFSPVTQRR